MSGLSEAQIDPERHRFPFCIVWTPIPCLTWFFPFVGHMGIATSRGVVRDFAASNYVSEDNMGFGWPTKYWQLSPSKVEGGAEAYDRAICEASDEYKCRTHNLICDNCHSHVAMALNLMKYDGSRNWNMVNLASFILFKGSHLGLGSILQQWLPFCLFMFILISISFLTLHR